MKTSVFAVLSLMALLAVAEKQPIERYQSIIDRQMFGPLPPGFDPTKSPSEVQRSFGKDERQITQEQEKLQSAIHFSVLDVRPDGEVVVGFTDNTDPKVPRNYFLKVGESRDGWTVKEADRDAATMTIAKDDVTVTLTLGGNSAAKAPGAAPAGSAVPAPGVGDGARRLGLLGGTLRGRRLQRQQAAAAADAKQREAEAAKEAEREAQAEQEKAQREADRAEQRQQLLAIQEELKKVREAKAAAPKNEGEGGANNSAN